MNFFKTITKINKMLITAILSYLTLSSIASADIDIRNPLDGSPLIRINKSDIYNRRTFKSKREHLPSAQSHTTKSYGGTGHYSTTESVSACQLFVNNRKYTEIEVLNGLVHKEKVELCYQACAVVSTRSGNRMAFPGADGEIDPATTIDNTWRSSNQVCTEIVCGSAAIGLEQTCNVKIAPFISDCNLNQSCYQESSDYNVFRLGEGFQFLPPKRIDSGYQF